MLDIGWSELAVVAVLALVVIGPKDLPRVMRTVGQWTRKARSVSREFQSSIDEMVREAELEDARKAIGDAKSLNIRETIEDTIDPDGEVKQAARDIKDGTRVDAGKSRSKSKSKSAGAEEPEPEATVVKHPVSVAPAHSLTPPEESAAGEGAPAGEEKSASGGGT